MKKEYIVQRKNVYVGQLMICQADEKSLDNESDEDNLRYKPNVLTGICARSMLLEKKSDNRMEDLIYSTPMTYPIIDDCWKMEEPYGIINSVCLDEILKYLKYSDELSREDLNKIFMVFVKHQNWVKRNIKLFGLEKSNQKYIETNNGQFSSEMFADLLISSYVKQTKPYKQEPFYKLIKKQK